MGKKKSAALTTEALTAHDDDLIITAITARAVVVPINLPLQTAVGAIEDVGLVLIDVATNQGFTGRSYLFSVGNHNLKPLVALVEAMAGMISGDVVAPLLIERKLRSRYALLGVHNLVLFAISGIDMALWDAWSQSLGKPLVSVLGGRPGSLRAYNSRGLGIMPQQELASEAAMLVDEGFDAVKIRLGRATLAEDLAAIRAVRKSIGANVTLMSDFNQGLTVNEAILRGRALDDEGLYWIEEPTRADDFAGNAKISAAVDTPISLGENFMGPEQMAQALDADCCDFVMPDVQRISGVSGWMRAAALAEAASLDMSSHLFPEYSCHLLAVTPTRHWLEYVDWANPVLLEPLQVHDSKISIPDVPGVGIQWDENAVSRYLHT